MEAHIGRGSAIVAPLTRVAENLVQTLKFDYEPTLFKSLVLLSNVFPEFGFEPTSTKKFSFKLF